MKNLLLISVAALALAGCNDKKESAEAAPQGKLPTKTKRPAAKYTSNASAQGQEGYPEGLKLIETAEQTSRAAGAAAQAFKMSARIGSADQATGGDESQANENAEETQAAGREARRAHAAAVKALKDYEGTIFEEEQIEAYFERDRLRKQAAELESQLADATASNDSETVKSARTELEKSKEKLAEMEEEWVEMSTKGWNRK